MKVTGITTTKATLTWAPVTAGKVDNYAITLLPTSGGATVDPAVVTKSPWRASLMSLTPGTEYTITIIALSGNKESVAARFSFTTSKLQMSYIARFFQGTV
jgi:hypothetical protein